MSKKPLTKLAKQKKILRLLNYKHYFCSAKKRPTICKYAGTNLCCLVCDNVTECIKENIGNGIKPCVKSDFDAGEECEFLC